MTYYIERLGRIDIHPDSAVSIKDKLRPGTYVIKYNSPFDTYFLETGENPSLPEKLYGSASRTADRIYKTYKSRDHSTGVLLSGEKGSGKTLLSKILMHLALRDAIPTLIVNEPFCGNTFNQFISSITQPCVVMFDEFEKVYREEKEQQQLLTLLDGTFDNKKLFLMTVNDEYRIDQNMKNRPGRLYYFISYYGLEEEFVTEYCNDKLDNKEHIPTIVSMTRTAFKNLNFDMLKALVEEMNRYGESPGEVLKFINARPSEWDQDEYEISIIYLATRYKVPSQDILTKTYTGNPLADKDMWLRFRMPANMCSPDEDEYPVDIDEDNSKKSVQALNLDGPQTLVSIDRNSNEMIFEKSDYRVTFKRFARQRSMNWSDAF